MATCPQVVTDTGYNDADPCASGVCWPWVITSWKDTALRELKLAQTLEERFTPEEKTALSKAASELADLVQRTGLNLLSIWNVSQYSVTAAALATVAKALRCLWYAVATRTAGQPPQTTQLPPEASTAEKKQAQRAWWESWIPDLSKWAPNLSWPKLPGIDIPIDSIWEKLKSWFAAIFPWVLGGALVWFFWPTIVRSIAKGRKRK